MSWASHKAFDPTYKIGVDVVSFDKAIEECRLVVIGENLNAAEIQLAIHLVQRT
ncbi:MAG: hypothetical protein LUO89_11740 [Methanothrix sp.]|nr:hypothetical protein [Methanothrix sp.]